MKTRLFVLGALLLNAGVSFGQENIYAAEAFRFSDYQQNGTARFRGLGGNHTALGGDASSTFGNPAGLAFYNRSELSISPMINLKNTQSTFLGSSLSDNSTKFSIGQLGLVFAGGGDRGSRWRRTTFGVTYHQNANYANRYAFQGRNNRSSFVDPIILDANDRNVTGRQINAEYDRNTNQATDLLAAAYQLYLLEGEPFVDQDGENSGPPYTRFDANRPRDQRGTFEATGAQSQWTFAYAGNLDDKLYLGLNVGLSRARYTTDFTLAEFIQGGQVFNSYSQRDQLSVTGNGFNISAGAIYKLSPMVQIGATFASPTFMSFRETFNQSVSVDPRLPNPVPGLNDLFTNTVNVQPNDFNYSVTTPLRASGGATVFLGGGKIGFLTATAEYVGYGGMRVTTSELDAQGNSNFRNSARSTVQNTYQNVINFRGGAEFRFNVLRVRGGVAYLADPYRTGFDNIDRSRLLFSGGLGVRNERFFADVSGTFSTFTTATTPYTLPNSADYGSAVINNNATNLMLSVGTFF
ncbi:hypothetical protein [Spirosoma montaniterrae]|uniref:Aromatic hydrocarbon degradation protein n=1 Tax=Spirosoma montaniterrae TaxID=1178516 RepID=A0A1P9WVE0_9BACT|nr:hypothetical protein [Spirosoma montaniterrae]AQG79339.1 hypothetical protein AWR27_08395 [Spirosoma montaniterrae]